MPGEYGPHRGCVMIWPVRPGSWPHGAREAQQTLSPLPVRSQKRDAVDACLRGASCGGEKRLCRL